MHTELKFLFSTNVDVEKLAKLGNHLLFSDLGQDLFNFGEIHFSFDKSSYRTYKDELTFNQRFPELANWSCGYAGCAIGELPHVFKEWIYDGNKVRLVNEYSNCSPITQAQWFFGITEDAAYLLFNTHSFIGYNVKELGKRLINLGFLPVWGKEMREVSAYEVGYNILLFIDLLPTFEPNLTKNKNSQIMYTVKIGDKTHTFNSLADARSHLANEVIIPLGCPLKFSERVQGVVKTNITYCLLDGTKVILYKN